PGVGITSFEASLDSAASAPATASSTRLFVYPLEDLSTVIGSPSTGHTTTSTYRAGSVRWARKLCMARYSLHLKRSFSRPQRQSLPWPSQSGGAGSTKRKIVAVRPAFSRRPAWIRASYRPVPTPTSGTTGRHERDMSVSPLVPNQSAAHG